MKFPLFTAALVALIGRHRHGNHVLRDHFTMNRTLPIPFLAHRFGLDKISLLQCARCGTRSLAASRFRDPANGKSHSPVRH